MTTQFHFAAYHFMERLTARSALNLSWGPLSVFLEMSGFESIELLQLLASLRLRYPSLPTVYLVSHNYLNLANHIDTNLT
jgi:hypothetical protein